MKKLLTCVLLIASLVSARTVIDTVGIERSDSGSKYIKIHAAYPRTQTIYASYTPRDLPAGVATELIDSSEGIGSVYVPVATAPARYLLSMQAFAASAINWTYTLTVDTVQLFTATTTSSDAQIRDLALYADRTRNLLYLQRTIKHGVTTTVTTDSAAFSNWGVINRVSWKCTPSGDARLLGVSGGIEQ